MMNYKKYSEFHTVTYKGQNYIYQPYMFGQGAWAYMSKEGNPSKTAPLALQYELNSEFFGRKETPSLYERFMKASKSERESMESESMTWLTLKMNAIKKNNKIPEGVFPKRKLFLEGSMYFYEYDAKTKKTLPIWDRYPLVIVIKKSNDGFLGLNLHYLAYRERSVFLSNLLNYKNYNILTDELMVNISYGTLKDNEKLTGYKECIKQYLFSHVESKMLPIESHEWIYASTTSFAKWQKRDKIK